MKTRFFVPSILTLIIALFAPAGETIKQITFKVSGNCEMCETRIEKAVKISEVKFASWDKKTKMLTVAYTTNAISADSLQKRIASVGHDTEKYKAPDAVYTKLPACCLYRK